MPIYCDDKRPAMLRTVLRGVLFAATAYFFLAVFGQRCFANEPDGAHGGVSARQRLIGMIEASAFPRKDTLTLTPRSRIFLPLTPEMTVQGELYFVVLLRAKYAPRTAMPASMSAAVSNDLDGTFDLEKMTGIIYSGTILYGETIIPALDRMQFSSRAGNAIPAAVVPYPVAGSNSSAVNGVTVILGIDYVAANGKPKELLFNITNVITSYRMRTIAIDNASAARVKLRGFTLMNPNSEYDILFRAAGAEDARKAESDLADIRRPLNSNTSEATNTASTSAQSASTSAQSASTSA
ncbi:MAG: hypothetical protein AABZ39_21165, partial [Spirochaetota bacterium]